MKRLVVIETHTGAYVVTEQAEAKSVVTVQPGGASASGGGAWGEIEGTLADQTDLQDALDDKVDDSELAAHIADSDPHVAAGYLKNQGTDDLSLGIGGLGGPAVASNVGSIALGGYAQATGISSVAVGVLSSASVVGAIAIGSDAAASGFDSIALGVGAATVGNYAVAIGIDAAAASNDSVAVGEGSSASGAYSTALGAYANASGINSVALGDHSVAAEPNIISVGDTGSERRVRHVAVGTQPTDAINLEQMEAAILEVGFSRRYEEAGDYIYAGFALPGSAEGDAVWTIRRLTYSAGVYVVTEEAINVTWTGRAGHTYV